MCGKSAIFYESASRPTARCVSGNTVYEECLQNGRYIGLYWSSTGQVQRENVVSVMPDELNMKRSAVAVWRRLNAFSLDVDGQSLDSRWVYVGGSTRQDKKGILESVIELSNTVRPVNVKVITKLDGSSVLVRYLEITNRGDKPAALGSVQPFAGRLWENLWQARWNDHLRMRTPFDLEAKTFFSIGYYQTSMHDVGNFGYEGNFVWKDVEEEYFVLSRLERQPYSAPFFIIRNNITGESFWVSLAWSAGYELKLWYDKMYCTLCMGLGPAGPAPLRVIAPGETVTTPPVHIAPLRGELDEAVLRWHSHLRSSVLAPRPEGKEMYTVAARVVEEPGDWILREIDIASKMGAEAFMVDAGWYGEGFKVWTENRGDWFEGEFLPKGGIAAIRNYTHARGMLFGLWMEAEALSINSKLFTEHPEWRISYDGESVDAVGAESILNLARPDTAAFFSQAVQEVIVGKQLDFFKLDYNNRIMEGGRYDVSGYAENQAWRHFECLYHTFDEIIEHHPNVALENCASGGGRNDLGMLSRFHYASQSDWSIFPFSIRAINGLTIFLPPETLCYYHNHLAIADKMTDLDTHLRVTLFCSPIFVGFGGQDTDRSTVYFQKTRMYIDLLKDFCRPIMKKATVFHHTPDIGLVEPTKWCVLEYADEKRTRGYVGLFRLGDDKSCDEYSLRLRGVDPQSVYDVTFHNTGVHLRLSGAELITNAFKVRLTAVNSSELILYQSID